MSFQFRLIFHWGPICEIQFILGKLNKNMFLDMMTLFSRFQVCWMFCDISPTLPPPGAFAQRKIVTYQIEFFRRTQVFPSRRVVVVLESSAGFVLGHCLPQVKWFIQASSRSIYSRCMPDGSAPKRTYILSRQQYFSFKIF